MAYRFEYLERGSGRHYVGVDGEFAPRRRCVRRLLSLGGSLRSSVPGVSAGGVPVAHAPHSSLASKTVVVRLREQREAIVKSHDAGESTRRTQNLAVRALVALAAIVVLTLRTAASPPVPVPNAGQSDATVFGQRTLTRHSNHTLTSFPHVRVEDERLAKFLAEGMVRSPTLSGIVDRLQASDVIVMVECDRRMKSNTAGRLTFLSKASDFRYVRARVAYIGARARQTALVGHELQHALEVAVTPAIDTVVSFEREYRRMGHISHHASTDEAIAYETDAAKAIQEQIMKELNADT